MLSILFANSTLLHAETNYETGLQAYQQQKYISARYHWNKSSSEGNFNAIYNLAVLLSKGLGGETDFKRAAALFEQAAETGLAVAQHNLALAYYTGNGVTQNFERAKKWWERAARQSYSESQFNLGALLWNGEGVNRNPEDAIKWFRQASTSGHLQAKTFLRSISKQVDVKIKEPGLEQIPEKSSKLSSTIASANKAQQLKEYNKAFKFWLIAANMGDAPAQLKVAQMYQQGVGVDKNGQLAYNFFKRSATNGQSQAQYQIGLYYLDGALVEENKTLALYWMQSAADNNHIQAINYIEQQR